MPSRGIAAQSANACGPPLRDSTESYRPQVPTAESRCIFPLMAKGSTAATAGIGFGTALAITISWSVNKSILWAIVHGIFSWFYVIYFALFK